MMKITIDLIKQYQHYLVSEEKSKATIEKYIHDLTAFHSWLKERELTKETILEYKAYLVENYAPASVNSVIAALNSFFEHNSWFELKIKSLKIQRQIFCQSEKELTKAEYERLLKAAKAKKNERLYLLMQTICATGIRVSELPYITVEAVRSGKAQVKLKGKIRIILLNKDLCNLLKKYIKENKIEKAFSEKFYIKIK